jgi:hypothetical protein
MLDITAPYREALSPYLAEGWTGVLPLPPVSKVAPPKGTTGLNGVDPEEDTLASYLDRGGNIALRLPKGVIGIDVDSYGEKVGQQTIQGAQERLGELPATWTSSRHARLSSGRTMLYRTPELFFKKGIKDVDVIQNHHRYLTAPPSLITVDSATGKHSTNGDEIAQYKWYSPSGIEVSEMVVPNIDDLADLPASWVEYLKDESATTNNNAGISLGAVDAWDANLAWLPSGSMCSEEKEKLRYYIAGYRNAGSRHDHTVKAVLSIVWSAAKGHTGAFGALDGLRDHFIKLVASDRGLETAKHEYDSIVSWSVESVKTKNFGHSEKKDPCIGKARVFGKKTTWKKY